MNDAYWNLGKLALAVASYPLWEIGIMSAYVSLLTASKKTERLPFFIRFVMVLVGASTLFMAAAMCYPIVKELGIIDALR